MSDNRRHEKLNRFDKCSIKKSTARRRAAGLAVVSLVCSNDTNSHYEGAVILKPCSPVGESPRRPFPSGTRPGGRRDKAFCISSLDGSPSRLETCGGEGRHSMWYGGYVKETVCSNWEDISYFIFSESQNYYESNAITISSSFKHEI